MANYRGVKLDEAHADINSGNHADCDLLKFAMARLKALIYPYNTA